MAVSVSEAIQRILQGVERLPTEAIGLLDARGRVLAEDIVAPLDLPAHTNSAMDGYAVRGDDVRGASKAAPRTLQIIEEIPAGTLPRLRVEPGTCARIFTGAALPSGADCVIRQEDTERRGRTVAVVDDRDLGKN